jgi:hypothetical protein
MDKVQDMLHSHTEQGRTWHKCTACCGAADNANRRGQYAPWMAPDYTKTILTADPMQLQMLGLIDASVHFSKRLYGVAKGTLTTNALLPHALVEWKGAAHGKAWEQLGEGVQQLLASNLQTNPIIQTFATLAERGFEDVGTRWSCPVRVASPNMPACGGPEQACWC